jgi:hypothetical protein
LRISDCASKLGDSAFFKTLAIFVESTWRLVTKTEDFELWRDDYSDQYWTNIRSSMVENSVAEGHHNLRALVCFALPVDPEKYFPNNSSVYLFSDSQACP